MRREYIPEYARNKKEMSPSVNKIEKKMSQRTSEMNGTLTKMVQENTNCIENQIDQLVKELRQVLKIVITQLKNDAEHLHRNQYELEDWVQKLQKEQLAIQIRERKKTNL